MKCAIVDECSRECLSIVKHLPGKDFDAELKNSTVERCTESATTRVLKHRARIKKNGIVETSYIEGWLYEKINKQFGKFYEFANYSDTSYSILTIRCIYSNDTKRQLKELQFY